MNEYFVWDDENDLLFVGEEPTTQKEALDISIEKWMQIVDRLNKELLVHQEGGGATCGLCMLYCFDFRNCSMCPVKIKTGKAGCVGSPYENWIDDESLESAEAELEFLLNLKKELGYE